MDKLVVIKKNSKCNFCGISKNDCLKYGPIYKLGNIRAHYYCVLLSNRLIQNGNDNEGILGFLLSDIQKELQRTLEVVCTYCKKGNATINCASKKCRRSFHLPCGMKGGSLHEFADQFKSFCHKHRPVQNIPQKILREAYKNGVICCICYESVNLKNKIDTLWAPCCSKTWYHRSCVQKLAYSAGYFFRCAACNDAQKFNKWMQRFGIFIPQQDASWELVPNAFEELLYRHGKCDAEMCKCPDGRQKNSDNTIWEIILCESCGSQGIHVACGDLKFLDPEWECPTCRKITLNLKSVLETSDQCSSKPSKLGEVSHKKRRWGSEDLKNSILNKRKKSRTLFEEDKIDDGDEFEIDVETVEEEFKGKQMETIDKEKDILNLNAINKEDSELEEVLALLKPGPLSYKLSLLKKIWEVSLPQSTTDESDSFDVIELSDSDDEKSKEVRENSEQKSLNDFDLISPHDAAKGLEEVDEKRDLNYELSNKNETIEETDKLTFSFTFHSEKWEIDNELYILNEIQPNSGCAEDFKGHGVIAADFFLPAPKNEIIHQWYHEEEVPIQDCILNINKSESDFREEEDFEISYDDEVISLTN